jgi:thymidylate synthase (FAD)
MDKQIFTLGDDIGSVQLIQSVGDDAGIVNAARVSFGKITEYEIVTEWVNEKDKDGNPTRDYTEKVISKSLKDADRNLLRYLLVHGHDSPFEHNSLTFLVKAPIFIARQWFRHRVGVSYNEISGRYVEVKEEFYTPVSFRKQSVSNRQASVEADDLNNRAITNLYDDALKIAYKAYLSLLKDGVCREQARGLLPQCTYTEFYFTCNLRSLLHFIKLRDSEHAQWEIQRYAKAMKTLASEIFPETFEVLEQTKPMTIFINHTKS